MMTSPFGLTQESLCSPCVDLPLRIDRQDFRSPGEVDVVTADDMRELGITSVADMVKQLAEEVTEERPVEPEESPPEPEDAANSDKTGTDADDSESPGE